MEPRKRQTTPKLGWHHHGAASGQCTRSQRRSRFHGFCYHPLLHRYMRASSSQKMLDRGTQTRGKTVWTSYAKAPSAPTSPRGLRASRAAFPPSLVLTGPALSGTAPPKSFAAATTADPRASPTRSATPVVTCVHSACPHRTVRHEPGGGAVFEQTGERTLLRSSRVSLKDEAQPSTPKGPPPRDRSGAGPGASAI